jgi:ribosome-associated protein
LTEDDPVRAVTISDDVIRLGQFMKLATLVDDGSEAKRLIATGRVQVNGEAEVRRGRQLHRGDVVTMGKDSVRVG